MFDTHGQLTKELELRKMFETQLGEGVESVAEGRSSADVLPYNHDRKTKFLMGNAALAGATLITMIALYGHTTYLYGTISTKLFFTNVGLFGLTLAVLTGATILKFKAQKASLAQYITPSGMEEGGADANDQNRSNIAFLGTDQDDVLKQNFGIGPFLLKCAEGIAIPYWISSTLAFSYFIAQAAGGNLSLELVALTGAIAGALIGAFNGYTAPVKYTQTVMGGWLNILGMAGVGAAGLVLAEIGATPLLTSLGMTAISTEMVFLAQSTLLLLFVGVSTLVLGSIYNYIMEERAMSKTMHPPSDPMQVD